MSLLWGRSDGNIRPALVQNETRLRDQGFCNSEYLVVAADQLEAMCFFQRASTHPLRFFYSFSNRFLGFGQLCNLAMMNSVASCFFRV